MIDPAQRYREALAAFAQPGGRWAGKGALTYWGRAAGLSADEIVADARAAGVTDRDADIRRGWADARTRRDLPNLRNTANFQRTRTPPPPPQHPQHVRKLIGDFASAAEHATADWVRELSPCVDLFGRRERDITAMFMSAAFRPDELLHVFRDDAPTVGKPGENLRTADDWIRAVLDGAGLPGDLIVANPFTGAAGVTTAGKPSFIAQSCLAAWPFMVLEMDDAAFAFGTKGDAAKGLAVQYAFWRGFIQSSSLAPALVSLTYSGGKSIHGLLHVGAGTLDDWRRIRARLVGMFATDPCCVTDAEGRERHPFRLDPQAMAPRQGTRIAGVRRFGNDALQELLYLNPRARAGTMWRETVPQPPPMIDPKGTPPCGAAYRHGGCGVCDRLADCPFADPDAVRGTTVKGGARCR